MDNLSKLIKKLELGAICGQQNIQGLWAGYGSIERVHLDSKEIPSLICKRIKLPRGQDSDFSNQRKIKSYQVESHWYKNYNTFPLAPKYPKLYGRYDCEGETLLLLEDLSACGFPNILQGANWGQMEAVIKWLAQFHANFLGESPSGLWDTGSYWHLATRPEEYQKLASDKSKKRLALSASLIDKKLSNAKYQTLIHGDAKLANFCFSSDYKKAAAVDFQYVGAGAGIKDLIYFMSSCLSSEDCYQLEEKTLETYFAKLKAALAGKKIDFEELKREWSSLYSFAWADFYRFLEGWSPSHWKAHPYTIQQAFTAQNSCFSDLERVARIAALKAGELIQCHVNNEVRTWSKAGSSRSSSVVTEVDLKAQEIILKELKPSIEEYDLGLLTEESHDNKSRLEKEYFWCVDPLDGTLAFSNGKPGYAVSIALVHQSGEPVFGLVYDPNEGNTYSASIGGGAKKNGEPFSLEALQRKPFQPQTPRLYADHSIKDDPRYKELKQQGIFGAGAVMNSIHCLENPPARYIKFPKNTAGGGSLWDFAAVALIVNEAGGKATDYNGEPLDLNREDSTYLNHRGIFISSEGD